MIVAHVSRKLIQESKNLYKPTYSDSGQGTAEMKDKNDMKSSVNTVEPCRPTWGSIRAWRR